MLNSVHAAQTQQKADGYLEAHEYLMRLRKERKMNEVTLQVFAGLYGIDMFNLFYAQGFFAFANN